MYLLDVGVSLYSTHRSVSTVTCTAREFLSCSLSPYVLASTWICQRTELRPERYLEFRMHVDSGNVRVYFPCNHPTSLKLSCRATAVVAASSGSCTVQLCLIIFHLSPCDSSSPLPICNASVHLLSFALSLFTQIWNIGFIIRDDPTAVGEYIGNYIAHRIAEFAPTASKKFVLGLPTGSSPIPTYKHLIKLVKAGKLSFKHVITFNMDEYVALPRNHPESYHAFMYVPSP
jgi:hypothetical protein